MLQLHNREVAGIRMAQIELPCGRKTPVLPTFREVEHCIDQLIKFGTISALDRDGLLADARGFEISEDHPALKKLVETWNVQPLVRSDLDTRPIEVDCRAAFITSDRKRLHGREIVTSTQGIHLLICFLRRGRIREEEQAGLLAKMLKVGLRPEYPHSWSLQNGLLPSRLTPLQEIRIWREFCVDNNVPESA